MRSGDFKINGSSFLSKIGLRYLFQKPGRGLRVAKLLIRAFSFLIIDKAAYSSYAVTAQVHRSGVHGSRLE